MTLGAFARVEDRAGNFMTISYSKANDARGIVPKQINYTGSASDPTTHRSVTFVYDTTRPDVDQTVAAAQSFSFAERLVRLEMRAPNAAGLTPLRTLSLGYSISSTTGRSLLSNIAESDGPAPSSIPVTGSTPLCRQEAFTYAAGLPLSSASAWGVSNKDSSGAVIADVSPYDIEGVDPTMLFLDVDADGRDDLLYLSTDPSGLYKLRLSTGTAFGPATSSNIPVAIPFNDSSDPPIGPTPPVVLDFDGDGHPDILVNQGTDAAPVAHIEHGEPIAWTMEPGRGRRCVDTLPGIHELPDRRPRRRRAPRPRHDERRRRLLLDEYHPGILTGLSNPAPLLGLSSAAYSVSLTNYFLDLEQRRCDGSHSRAYGPTTLAWGLRHLGGSVRLPFVTAAIR